jgi:hypothetical protein
MGSELVIFEEGRNNKHTTLAVRNVHRVLNKHQIESDLRFCNRKNFKCKNLRRYAYFVQGIYLDSSRGIYRKPIPIKIDAYC